MATKNIFSIDGAHVKSFISNAFSKIGKLRFIANTESGKNIVDLPLIAVIIVGILLPFLSAILLVIGLLMSVKIEIVSRANDVLLLDKQ
jgi:hypothetical protein